MRRANMMRSFAALESSGERLAPWQRRTINDWEKGLLYRHGRLDAVLDPGPVRRWGAGYTLRTVDTRARVVTLPMQEIASADGAALKVTVAAHVRVVDPVAYVTGAQDAHQSLYLAIQIALRDVVTASNLDEVLAGRGELSNRLLASLEPVDTIGLAVDRLAIKDIILPSELKKALAEVLIARAAGSASLERARGETAALRSLANAARMAADNPALVQLRLLQQLESSKGHTIVIGAPSVGATPTTSSAPPGPTATL